MKISQEWAKQLAFNVIGRDLDFAKMTVLYAPEHQRAWVVPVYPDMDFSWNTEPDMSFSFEREYIEIGKICDPINREFHYFGYGPRTNTIVICGEPDDRYPVELLHLR